MALSRKQRARARTEARAKERELAAVTTNPPEGGADQAQALTLDEWRASGRSTARWYQKHGTPGEGG